MSAANGVAAFHFSPYSRASGRQHANWMSSSVSAPAARPGAWWSSAAEDTGNQPSGSHSGYQGIKDALGRLDGTANGLSDGVHAPEGRDGGDERLRIDRFGEVQLKSGRQCRASVFIAGERGD